MCEAVLYFRPTQHCTADTRQLCLVDALSLELQYLVSISGGSALAHPRVAGHSLVRKTLLSYTFSSGGLPGLLGFSVHCPVKPSFSKNSPVTLTRTSLPASLSDRSAYLSDQDPDPSSFPR